MKQVPLLSILIPTRNRERYLKYAIQSALNLPSPRIEVLVSENHGKDQSLALAQSFSDNRLKVYQPASPLPMHENYEFLIKKATGKWLTILGDDDAIMPHAFDYLHYIDCKYKNAEAIYSSRAEYFWESAYEYGGAPRCNYTLSNKEIWIDSKKQLRKCLAGQINYLSLPQLYSGGFHKRTLIQRVLSAQNGTYYKSVLPDSYSAIMALLFTHKYLEVGLPMTWVGTSPRESYGGKIAEAKDHESDFFDLHNESLTMNRSLGSSCYYLWPLHLFFYEAFISATPLVSPEYHSMKYVHRVFRNCAYELLKARRFSNLTTLKSDLDLANRYKYLDNKFFANLLYFFIASHDLIGRVCNKLVKLLSPSHRIRRHIAYSETGFHLENILSVHDKLESDIQPYIQALHDVKPVIDSRYY